MGSGHWINRRHSQARLHGNTQHSDDGVMLAKLPSQCLILRHDRGSRIGAAVDNSDLTL